MIKYTPSSQITLEGFKTPFEASLDPRNRWVVLAEHLPWDKMASVLMKKMSSMGRGSIDLRCVLGALIIKGMEGLSDRETIRSIQENIYMQYFVGLSSFQTSEVFVPVLFVEIRKRLGEEGMALINDILIEYSYEKGYTKHRKKYTRKQDDDDSKPPKDASSQKGERKGKEKEEEVENRGTLQMDATVAPQDIKYPTDTRLLNECRLAAEELIDRFHEQGLWGEEKPRTYRRIAKKKYLAFAKKKGHSKKQIRKCIKKQLQYVRRDIKYIDELFDKREAEGKGLPEMSKKEYRNWLVLQQIYRQQGEMYKDKRRKIADRIVSLHQPWIRPIKRGKAGADTEFGAKLNASQTNGLIRVDRIDYNNFNEALGLKDQIESYRTRFGYYPEDVLVDKIYLNRKNRKYLKDNGIKHYGPQLGRPKEMSHSEKQKRKKKQNKRSEIEGKFGQAKTKFGMNKIKMRRDDTSKLNIHLIALSMNILSLWKGIIFLFLSFVRSINGDQKRQIAN